MNVALPVVLAAAVVCVGDGAVIAGVSDFVGAVVEGEVDCAIALVNASVLTAATAMTVLSMDASFWGLLRMVFRVADEHRLPGMATREPPACSLVRHSRAAIRSGSYGLSASCRAARLC